MPRGSRQPQNEATGGALDWLVYEIGHKLGEAFGSALVNGVREGVERRGPGRNKLVRAAPSVGRSLIEKPSGEKLSCLVPGCGRQGVAKGLCATHYRKARRLKFGNTLTSAQLSELAEDGRKTRFAKRAA